MSAGSLQKCEPEHARMLATSQPEKNWIAGISLEALLLAGEHMRRGASIAEISAGLYRYNSIPLSPALSRSLGSTEAIDDFLGLLKPEMRTLLSHHWFPSTRLWEPGAWHGWSLRSVPWTAESGPLLYKLYISPTLEHVGTVLRLIVPVLAQVQAPAFKWGRNLSGLLRPDKLVVYFYDRESLFDCAARLRVVLDSAWAQGVPFTAEIGETRLLSWARDPCPNLDAAMVTERLSWRQWLCGRMANSLVCMRHLADRTEPWRFVLESLDDDGVDTQAWTWRQSMAAAK